MSDSTHESQEDIDNRLRREAVSLFIQQVEAGFADLRSNGYEDDKALATAFRNAVLSLPAVGSVSEKAWFKDLLARQDKTNS